MVAAGVRVVLFVLALQWWVVCPRVARADEAPAREREGMAHTEVVKETFHGWPNTYRLSNGIIEARVVTDVGPRIMDFHHSGGANLLYVRASEAGKTGEAEWVQRGGWRLWIAPERRETTYALDNSPCAAEVVGDDTLRVTGPPQAAAGIQKSIEVSLKPGESRLRIISRVKNVSDHTLTYAAWSLPVLRPGGRAFVPQDIGSLTAFDAIRRLLLWSYTKMEDPRYHFGDRLIEIDHTKVKPAPAGQSGRRDDESKIGVNSAQGWAAYLLDGTLFLKRFPHDPTGEYPDGGATIEVYSSREFTEVENLGPLTTITPGEEIVLPEDWWLFTAASVPRDEPGALQVLNDFVARTSPHW
jgi:hypothetical protein